MGPKMQDKVAARKSSRLFTLLDIVNHYCARQITLTLEETAVFQRTLAAMKRSHGGGAIPTSEQTAKFSGIVRLARDLCIAVGFNDGLQRVLRITVPKSDANEKLDVSTMIAGLNAVKESLYDEMSKRHFLLVAPDRVAYLEGPPKIFPFETTYQDSTFWGTGGNGAFPSAVNDIKAAGNCLAAECNTAAVFHAMRVAEHGIRVLAKRLKVTLTDKGKPMPIEFGTWEKVLAQVKNRIAAASQMQRNAKRQKRLAHYSDLADRCTYMKDLWRNDVMHARATFNRLDAAGILQHVREFMQSIEPR